MGTAELIPIELGQEIPHLESRCAECGMRMKSSGDDLEPLCWGCATRDELVAEFAAKDIEHARARRGVFPVEPQVPVEYARIAGRPFGLGFGEIGSSRITQALAEDRAGKPPVLAALVVAGALCTLVGLLVLAVAAVA